MEFEWDERKRVVNLAKHGLDFVDVAAMFEDHVIELPDQRRDYGEDRIWAYGQLAGVALLVIYTPRGECRRLISARAASREERAFYGALYTRAAQPDEGRN